MAFGAVMDGMAGLGAGKAIGPKLKAYLELKKFLNEGIDLTPQ